MSVTSSYRTYRIEILKLYLPWQTPQLFFLKAFLANIPWLLKTFDARFVDEHVVTLLCNALEKQNSNLQVKCIPLTCQLSIANSQLLTLNCQLSVSWWQRMQSPWSFIYPFIDFTTSSVHYTLIIYSLKWVPDLTHASLTNNAPHTDCRSPSALWGRGQGRSKFRQLDVESGAQSLQRSMSQ